MTPIDTSCRAMLAHVSAYLDGELEAAECAAIDRHCRTCPQCTAVIAGLRRTIGLCRDAGKAPLPDAIRSRARQRINRLLEARRPPGRTRGRRRRGR
jgi:anti-sigma factor RsiW